MFLVPQKSLACTCGNPATVPTSLETSVAVFSGEVSDVKQSSFFKKSIVTFTVTQAWKGVDTKSIQIKTESQSSECGFTFLEGIEYLVYAKGKDDNSLETSACDRTKWIAAAQEDLDILGEGKLVFKDDSTIATKYRGLLTLLFGIPSFIIFFVLLSYLRRHGSL